jgi:hypothetical protein
MSSISPEREAKIFARFAEGATTRQVATEFGVGTGPQRGRSCGTEASKTPYNRQPAASETTREVVDQHEVVEAPDFAGRLAELRQLHDSITDVVTTYEDRAQASRSALAELEAERLDMLARGLDAQPLRQRRRDAEDDLADSEKAAELVREQLAIPEQQIAETTASRELVGRRAELAAAVAARDAVYARSADRQRAAVAAVWAAAQDFATVPADEQAADVAVASELSVAASLCPQLGEPVPVVATAALSRLPGLAARRPARSCSCGRR